MSAFDAAAINDRESLAHLPILRKSALQAAQKANPPFGDFVIGEPKDFGRIFMSPGPIWEPQGLAVDPWGAARALFAAGFRPGDVIHNAFAHHNDAGWFYSR